MTKGENRDVITPLLRAAALLARIEKRVTIAEQVGWPVDVSADVAEGRRLLRQSRLELGAAHARQPFRARYPAG